MTSTDNKSIGKIVVMIQLIVGIFLGLVALIISINIFVNKDTTQGAIGILFSAGFILMLVRMLMRIKKRKYSKMKVGTNNESKDIP